MLIVETIRKVRMALAKGKSQREVAKKYSMSRNTVRKIAASGETEFKYATREVSYPVLGPHILNSQENYKRMLLVWDQTKGENSVSTVNNSPPFESS